MYTIKTEISSNDYELYSALSTDRRKQKWINDRRPSMSTYEASIMFYDILSITIESSVDGKYYVEVVLK